MKTTKLFCSISALMLILSANGPASAQDCKALTDLTSCVNAKIKSVVKARIDQTSNSKQVEPPSISSNTTSLVDQSSASDLIGVGLNLAGLSASSMSDDMQPSSVSVTTSAYAFYAAFKQFDPLNPFYYDKHRPWRKFSITLGYDDEKLDDGSTKRAKVFGAKYLFINKRDPGLKEHEGRIETVFQSLRTATGSASTVFNRTRVYIFTHTRVFNDIVVNDTTEGFESFLRTKLSQASDTQTRDRITDLLTRFQTNPGSLFVFGPRFTSVGSVTPWTDEERAYYTLFIAKFTAGSGYTRVLGLIGEEELEATIAEFVEDDVENFVGLEKVSIKTVQEIQRAPQLALVALVKTKKDDPDEYMGELTFDWGIENRVNLTLNGAFDYVDSKLVGADTRGGKVSAQLQFQINGDNLQRLIESRRSAYFYLAAEGKWMTGIDSMIKGQAKLTVPLPGGIDLPLSVTVANRTELIDEKEVRGQFGFTFDLSRLVQAFKPK